MANIGESHTARLARERLEAIKNFIPVRDSIKQKLQLRQQAREGFAESAEELFKPVTAATKAVTTAIVGKPHPKDPDREPPGLLQVLQQHGEILEGISAGIHPPSGAEAAAGSTFVTKKIKSVKITTPAERFKPEFVKMFKETPEDQLAEVILDKLVNMSTVLSPKSGSVSGENFIKYLYRIYYNKPTATGPKYNALVQNMRTLAKQPSYPPPSYSSDQESYRPSPSLQRQEQKSKSPELKKQQVGGDDDDDDWEDADDFTTSPGASPPSTRSKKELEQEISKLLKRWSSIGEDYEQLKFKKDRTEDEDNQLKKLFDEQIAIDKKIKELKALKKSGSGYTCHGYNICPDSVINDVSRLEILIGGKRAGNNSREIINEAAGICQGLFQNKMIDSHIYRELIDELIDD